MSAELPDCNEVIHAPRRLRVCAMLSAVHRVESGMLQECLGLSESALSKHLTHLTDAGYVTRHRGVRDFRSRLWLSLTPEGTRAYTDHVRALQQIIASDAS